MAEVAIVVIGAGGHAKVVIDALRSVGTEPLGVVARSRAEPLGVRYLGDEREFDQDPATCRLVNGVGSVRPGSIREEIYARFQARGYAFEAVRHASAVVAPDAAIARGTQLMAGCVVQPGVVLGENTIVNTRASVDHDCVIGAHVHLAPGVVLSGDVRVGAGTHVGTGAVVIQGVTIGAGSLIAAGAVVTRDVPDRSTVRGVPARAD